MYTSEDITSIFLKKIGCDEVYLVSLYIPEVSGRKYLLKFGKRYMELTITYMDVIALHNYGPNNKNLFEWINSEVEDFLLTGKNEVTDLYL